MRTLASRFRLGMAWLAAVLALVALAIQLSGHGYF
jgi:hypothetical protein